MSRRNGGTAVCYLWARWIFAMDVVLDDRVPLYVTHKVGRLASHTSSAGHFIAHSFVTIS